MKGDGQTSEEQSADEARGPAEGARGERHRGAVRDEEDQRERRPRRPPAAARRRRQDNPNVEGTALTVLDRAMLLPRALIQRQVQTHHLKHMTCACAWQYMHVALCTDDAQVHAVMRIVAARAELDPRRGPWQVQPHHDELH